MHIKDYIKIAKKEIDELERKFIEGHKTNPSRWPLDLTFVQWIEQERASRYF